MEHLLRYEWRKKIGVSIGSENHWSMRQREKRATVNKALETIPWLFFSDSYLYSSMRWPLPFYQWFRTLGMMLIVESLVRLSFFCPDSFAFFHDSLQNMASSLLFTHRSALNVQWSPYFLHPPDIISSAVEIRRNNVNDVRGKNGCKVSEKRLTKGT